MATSRNVMYNFSQSFVKTITRGDLVRVVAIERGFHCSNGALSDSKQPKDHPEHKDDKSFKNEQSQRSHHYQNYHRRAYEKKRSFYTNEREQNSNDTNSKVSYSFASGANHYERLNLTPQAELSDIKSSYYSLSKQYHPDVAAKDDVQAAERFRLITESYDILSDSKARADYDKSLNLISPPNPDAVWTPKSSDSNQVEFNAIYRMRQADQIFRFRQEEELEREKRLYPQKFKAGNFDRVGDKRSLGEQIDLLDKQIDYLKDNYTNDVYKSALFEHALRRRYVLGAKFNQSQSSQKFATRSSSNDGLIVSFFGVLIMVVFASQFMFRNEQSEKMDDLWHNRKEKTES